MVFVVWRILVAAFLLFSGQTHASGLLTPEVLQACPWMLPHNGSNSTVLCEDGEYVTDWKCVEGGHGQRVQCPPDYSTMCTEKKCGGGLDHCCNAAITCLNEGGPRLCPLMPQEESSENPFGNMSSCDLAIDLSTETSPFSGSTSGHPDTVNLTCGGASGERLFYIDVPSSATVDIGMISSEFDSRHEIRWGGTCPGQNLVACVDEPDTQRHHWTNLLSQPERAFFIIDAWMFGSGSFSLTWDFVCNPPMTIGYNFTDVGGVLTMTGFAPTGITCADGYIGEVQVSICESAVVPYSVSGCQAICSVPTTVGYNFADAGGVLTVEGFAPTGVTCADDYTGEVKVSVCASAGGPYSVSGCLATCSAPPATTGYNFTDAGGVLTITGFAPTGVTCASGYTGEVKASACESAGAPYVVSGCQATCSVPTTIGYNFADAGGVLTITGFAPTGVTCADDYTGEVNASVCESAGTPYLVSGCTESLESSSSFPSSSSSSALLLLLFLFLLPGGRNW